MLNGVKSDLVSEQDEKLICTEKFFQFFFGFTIVVAMTLLKLYEKEACRVCTIISLEAHILLIYAEKLLIM